MKKLLLLSWMFALSLSALADGETIDGSTIKKITFSGDAIILTYSDGTTQSLDDMSTVVIDMSKTTGIEERKVQAEQSGLEGKTVYNLGGQQMGSSLTTLQKGVYIVGDKKVIVK